MNAARALRNRRARPSPDSSKNVHTSPRRVVEMSRRCCEAFSTPPKKRRLEVIGCRPRCVCRCRADRESVSLGRSWRALKADCRDATTADQAAFYGIARAENHTFARYESIVGVGVRITMPSARLRGTFGFGVGLARQATRYVRASRAVTVVPDGVASPVRDLPGGGIATPDLGVTTVPCHCGTLGSCSEAHRARTSSSASRRC
jgi:hypothetical protein